MLTGACFNLCLRKQSLRKEDAQTFDMCEFHFNVFVMVTPRYLKFVTSTSGCDASEYGKEKQ